MMAAGKNTGRRLPAIAWWLLAAGVVLCVIGVLMARCQDSRGASRIARPFMAPPAPGVSALRHRNAIEPLSHEPLELLSPAQVPGNGAHTEAENPPGEVPL